MKTRRNLFLTSFLSLALTQASHAETYYWDTNGDTEGFGTAGGTWGSSDFWGTSSDGTGATANTTITTADAVNFGSTTDGLAAGTITGPASEEGFLSMTFGEPSGNIILSGGTLNLAPTSTITVNNSAATVSSVLQGTSNLTKNGPGTLTLSGANTYSGITTIGQGTLAFSNTTPTATGGLTFGDSAGSTTTSALDLTNGSATFGGTFTVRTNSATANTIAIGSEKALTINGNVAIGNFALASTTKLTATGAGTFTANLGTSTFNVGGPNNGGNANASTVDFSGLSIFNINSTTNASSLTLGNNTGSNVGGVNTLTLGQTSSITVGSINLGNNQTSNHLQTLKLGSTSNTLNVATLSLGTGTSPSGGGRGNGALNFNTTTGTLVLRGYTGGTSRANVNLGTGGNTGNGAGTIDVTAHSVDMMIGTLNMASSTSTSAGNNIFKFDTGTLDITTANVGVGSNSNGTARATLQIGSSSASTGIATIGSLVLANSNSTGTLNILGGTLTMGGNITEGTGASSLMLSGGTLDMGGFAIGTLAAPINTRTFESGTLKNVASINGTAGITKTTAGTLTLSGNNTYAGQTTISAGTLKVGHANALGTAGTFDSRTTINNGGTLELATDTSVANEYLDILTNNSGAVVVNRATEGEGITQSVGFAYLGSNSALNATKGANVASGTATLELSQVLLVSNSVGTSTLNADTAAISVTGLVSNYVVSNKTLELSGSHADSAISGAITDGSGANGTVSLEKSGSGTWSLTSNANTYTGNTTVTAGTLSLGDGTTNTNLADEADVIVAAGAMLHLNYSGTDVIGELWFDGLQMPPGIYSSTSDFITGTGTLTVPSSSSDYDTWAGPGGFNLTGGPDDDDDGDGLSNFEEYAFGLDPTSGSSVNPITQQLDKGTGIFKYTRRATPATTGVIYTYESSTTLSAPWDPLTPDSTSTDSATPTEEITVDIPDALLTEPKLFIRVKAVKP